MQIVCFRGGILSNKQPHKNQGTPTRIVFEYNYQLVLVPEQMTGPEIPSITEMCSKATNHIAGEKLRLCVSVLACCPHFLSYDTN